MFHQCGKPQTVKNVEIMSIYLDYAATTPLDPEVERAMADARRQSYGNPSSPHERGRAARKTVERARAQVASLVGASANDVIFTSGATEALHLGIAGLVGRHTAPTHVITCATEHRAVLGALASLEKGGVEVTRLEPMKCGTIDPEELRAAWRESTSLVCLMWANNETGVLHPIAELAQVCRELDVPLLTDATQAVGKVDVGMHALGIQALALSAHKFSGPMGVGALIATAAYRRCMSVPLDGGGQEKGLRPGTLNVPGIVGLGAAAELAEQRMDTEPLRFAKLRNAWERGLRARFPKVVVHGFEAQRAAHISCFSIPSVDAQALVARAHDVCISQGSACSSLSYEPSHVLRAMRCPYLKSAVRVSVGRTLTLELLYEALERFCAHVSHLS